MNGMEPIELENKNQIGIVVESYNPDPQHRVVVVQLCGAKSYFFFYVPEHPAVEFGDVLLMNFYSEKYKICRGNDRLTYSIHPLTFPGDLLLELISERLNQ